MGSRNDRPEHLNHRLLDDFFLGEVPGRELLDRAVGHLEILPVPEVPGSEGVGHSPEAAPDRPLRLPVLEPERPSVARLEAELEGLEPEERALRLTLDPRFHTVPFARRCLVGALDLVESGRPGSDRFGAGTLHVLARCARSELGAGEAAGEEAGEETEPAALGAEAWLLDALQCLRSGDAEGAEAGLEAARRRARRAPRGSVARTGGFAGIFLARGRMELARGHGGRGRRFLEAALRAARRAGGGLWRWPAATGLAALELRAGRAREAVALLEGLPLPPEGAALENGAVILVLALAAAGEGARAEAVLAAWEGGGGGERGPGGGDEAARRRSARAAVLRAIAAARAGRGVRAGSPSPGEAVERRLGGAREACLAAGLGLEAALGTAVLARRLLAAGKREELIDLVGDLERFADCPDLSGAELARLSRWAGRVTGWAGQGMDPAVPGAGADGIPDRGANQASVDLEDHLLARLAGVGRHGG